MNHPDPEMLAGLALGEPVPDEVRDHVRHCPPCHDEVTALSATREIFRGPHPGLVEPPASVRAAVLAAAREPYAVPERADADADADDREPTSRRGVRPAWLVAAAAAGLLVGGGAVAAYDRTETPDAPVVLARATLDTLDTGAAGGSADLVEHDGRTDLAVHTQPLSAGDGYLEVWLINADGERMVSVGVLPSGSTDQSFPVPRTLVAQGYLVVDISREPFDTDTTHSGDSLVRGTLAL